VLSDRCRFAIAIPNLGPFADPSEVVRLAKLAEDKEWDGFFLWDHVLWTWPEPTDVINPWPVLGAIAQTTESVAIGTMLTPVARRRPWDLAREMITLDHLSRGRGMFGVGLGSPADDFFPFWPVPKEVPATATTKRLRAAELDERRRCFCVGLQLLDDFLSGAEVNRDDDRCTVRNVTVRPRAHNDRTIPILIGGNVKNPDALRLAAVHAGGVPIAYDGDKNPREPSFEEICNYAKALQKAAVKGPPLVALWAHMNGQARTKAEVARYEKVGMNWWIETVPGGEEAEDPRNSISFLERRIRAGPIEK
jgi:alkanesulfonate monooxygenase SsuD/methylene tetrahydromethanopterin reductase-like flavin-dependent oxidoreductase (luciferase family)